MNQNEFYVCTNCGAEHPIEDLYTVGGDLLCEDCAQRLTVLCDECGARIYDSETITAPSHALCQDCYDDHYDRCHDCHRIMHRYHAHYDDRDNAFCTRCWGEKAQVIHEYSYKPDLIFHGEGLRHFGVELEMDCGGTDRDNAQILLNIANSNTENLYIKTDGSLDDGLELVTHPMTLEYHLNEMPWDHFSAKRKVWAISAMPPALADCMFTSRV